MKKKLLLLLCLLSVFLGGCLWGGVSEDLLSRNPEVRYKAIYEAAENKEKDAVPVLMKLLEPEFDQKTRMLSAWSLGVIGQSSAVPSLEQLLLSENDDLVAAAAEALGKIGDPKAIPALEKAFANKNARYTVIWALGAIGSQAAEPFLTGMLNHEDQFVRYNAAQSLKKIGLGS